MNTNRQTIVRARSMGVATLALFVLTLVLEAVKSIYPGVLPLELFVIAIGVLGCVAYALFVYGLVPMGMAQNSRIAKTGKLFAILSLVFGVVLTLITPPLVPVELIDMVVLPLMILTLFVFGILSIRISKDVKDFEPTLGTVAKRAALWNRIAGWLMVTLVLSPVGAVLSLIADYYMWRMQGVFLAKEPAA